MSAPKPAHIKTLTDALDTLMASTSKLTPEVFAQWQDLMNQKFTYDVAEKENKVDADFPDFMQELQKL